MHCITLCLVTIFTITHGLKFPGLPTSEDIKNAKVIYHRKKVCLLIPGKENCVYNEKSPGDPDEVASFIQIHQFDTGDAKENLEGNNKEGVEDRMAEEDDDEPPAEIHKLQSAESAEPQSTGENEERTENEREEDEEKEEDEENEEREENQE